MARLPRYFARGQAQHIIQRGNNRLPIFIDEMDFRFFLKCLKDAAETQALFIHAYVLMTNHTHLLASPHQDTSIPKTLQSVGRRYVRYFNIKYERTGTLWEGRYRATMIDSERYLLTCMRYIELNPVRAGMVTHPADYPWSSYACNAMGRQDGLIRHHSLFESLGHNGRERHHVYQNLFAAHIPDDELVRIRDCTNKGWVLGSEAYKKRSERLCRRRARPVAPGRPGKKPR